MSAAGTSYVRCDPPLPYCKGCGHGLVLRALDAGLTALALDPSDVAVVTDIGCVGLADARIEGPHTVHTTHGRSTAFAVGLAVADAALGAGRLKTIVLIGDGGAMIGLNHLVHAALLNADVTVLVHDNFVFGMTGGQGSAFSPLGFVTATTPAGNAVPPLDLARVLLAARAPFVARAVATDRDLADVVARAIAHPGFAVVEVLELCPAHAVRRNALTGGGLRDLAEDAGYRLGVLRDEVRPPAFARPTGAAGPARPRAAVRAGEFRSPLAVRRAVILAGTAGERVQGAAAVLADAALASGLHVTQKNDNPVTQGTGFSVSEVLLAPERLRSTGIERPDVLLVVSQDGCEEIRKAGRFDAADGDTVAIVDDTVELPPTRARVVRGPFRRRAGASRAALAAVLRWSHLDGAVPREAIERIASDRGLAADLAAAAGAVADEG